MKFEQFTHEDGRTFFLFSTWETVELEDGFEEVVEKGFQLDITPEGQYTIQRIEDGSIVGTGNLNS